MTTSSRPPVLRTVHLSPEADDELRRLAFNTRRSKADVVRILIEKGLRDVYEHGGADEKAQQKFLASLETPATMGTRATVEKGIQRDLISLQRAIDDAADGHL